MLSFTYQERCVLLLVLAVCAAGTLVQHAMQSRPEVRTFLEPSGETAAFSAPAASAIDVNTATAAQLESLPGVGPVTAQRIVRYREEHGPFQRPDDLDRVYGIGPVLLQKLAGRVSLSESVDEGEAE